ncbi:MAG: hypothetical protein GXZ11_06265 [Tissierellia bacterium]|nr:hypothetical protein [Tissierellia bacterium]
MKKWLILLLCLTLVLGVVACGKTEAPPKEENAETKEAEGKEKSDKTEDSPEIKGDFTEEVKWKAILPKGLIKNEETSKDDKYYSKMEYGVKEGEEFETKLSVRIDIRDKATSTREDIVKQGFDLKEYAEKKIDGAINLGDAYCVKYNGKSSGDETVVVQGRDEARTTDIVITFYGAELDKEQQMFLDSFTLLTEDLGKKDAPFPWEGSRFEPTVKEAQIGKYKLNAEYIKLEEPITTYETFKADSVVSGEYLYIIIPKELYIYKLGEKNTLVKKVDIEDGIEHIGVDAAGRVIASGFMEKALVFEGEEQTMTLSFDKRLSVSPFTDFAISYFLNPLELKKVVIGEEGDITESDFKLSDASGVALQGSVSPVLIEKNSLGGPGSFEDDDKQGLGIYGHDGNFIIGLKGTENDPVGSIHGYAEGANGYLAADSNMRDFKIWAKDGTYIGAVEDGDFLGTDYPWFSMMKRGLDDIIYLTITQERADKSSREVLVFKLVTDL